MRFDEQCKVIIDTMDDSEARAFVKFLKSEILRHQVDIRETNNLIKIVKSNFDIRKEWQI